MSRKGQTPESVFGPASRLKGRMRYAPTLPAGEAAILNDDRLAINTSSPPPPSIYLLKRCGGGSGSHLFTRNDQKEVCGHFGSPETTKKWFAAISDHPKRLKSGLRPFRVARNDRKEVCGHFGSPETTKKWFAAISGEKMRRRGAGDTYVSPRSPVKEPVYTIDK